jgi:hypothetical protein
MFWAHHCGMAYSYRSSPEFSLVSCIYTLRTFVVFVTIIHTSSIILIIHCCYRTDGSSEERFDISEG